MRFDLTNRAVPSCQLYDLDFVDKEKINEIYNPIYIDKPIKIRVSSPKYFGLEWTGLTALDGLMIKSYQGQIEPVKFKNTHYEFVLKPLPKAGEFYYFAGKLTKPINSLKICIDKVE